MPITTPKYSISFFQTSKNAAIGSYTRVFTAVQMFNSSGITESISMNFICLLESQTPEKDVWINLLGNNQTRSRQLRMKYIRDTTGDPDSQQPPRSQSIRICIYISSTNVILTSFNVLVSYLQCTKNKTVFKTCWNDVFRTGYNKKHSTQRYPSLYEVCALLRLFMCIITVQYRSYTINSHTNPHNLASRRLWWVAGLSVVTPSSICLFKETKKASKERKKNKQNHCTRQRKWQKSPKLATVTRHKLVINLTSLLRLASAWVTQAGAGSLRDSGPSGCEGD